MEDLKSCMIKGTRTNEISVHAPGCCSSCQPSCTKECINTVLCAIDGGSVAHWNHYASDGEERKARDEE